MPVGSPIVCSELFTFKGFLKNIFGGNSHGKKQMGFERRLWYGSYLRNAIPPNG